MTEKTAVQWLISQQKHGKFFYDEIIEQAQSMQKEQMIRFAISCHQDILRSRKAPENLISENLLLFEEYYNKTYGK